MNEKHMTKKEAQPLSISLPKAEQEKVRALAKIHGLPLTGILRLALRAGLPLVENQLGGI
jgi:hypothetical protein